MNTDAEGKQESIKVHFKGYTPRWDEVIDLATESKARIKEVGAVSGAHGWAKTNKVYQERLMIEMHGIRPEMLEPETLPPKQVSSGTEPRQDTEHQKHLDWIRIER